MFIFDNLYKSVCFDNATEKVTSLLPPLLFTLPCFLTHVDSLSGSHTVSPSWPHLPSREAGYVKDVFIDKDPLTAPEQALDVFAMQCDH